MDRSLVGQFGVAVLGGGPVGLAATAHLLSYGLVPTLYEAGPSIGNNLLEYGHVPLFSPWRYNIDSAAEALLRAEGWQAPELDALPTAREVYESYLRPLAATQAIAPHLHTNSRVIAVTRVSSDKVHTNGREASPFLIRLRTGQRSYDVFAGAVIDTTGTWNTPNALGSNGLPAIGEDAVAERVFYGIPDVKGKHQQKYVGKTTLVVGAGHSAAHALLGLVDLQVTDSDTTVHWAVRGKNLQRVFGGGDADQLPARGALGTRLQERIASGRLSLHTQFAIREIQTVGNTLRVIAGSLEEPHILENIDEIICATGSRPDLAPTRELRLRFDAALESSEYLAPLIDPNLHSCGSVPPHGYRELRHPEQNFFIAGAKSYGRAPTFLMATGYEQVRSIAAALAGDFAAAADVRLNLPETGVCSANFDADATSPSAGASCCAEPVVEKSSSCCVPASPAEATLAKQQKTSCCS